MVKLNIKNIIKYFLIMFFIILICLSVNLFYQNYYGKYTDVIDSINTQLLNVNMSDFEKVLVLMNYSYNYIPGVCTQKSNSFEALATRAGFKTEHLAMVCGKQCSHAVSRVLLNDSWVYVDSYFGNIFTIEEYKHYVKNDTKLGYMEFNFTTTNRHINCYYGDCHNFNTIELIFYRLFYIKKVF